MEYIKVQCDKCNGRISLKAERLKEHYNKKIKVPCKRCNSRIKLHITPELLNNKSNHQRKQFKTDILGDQNAAKSFKVGQLYVFDEGNHQVIQLEVGENIIGRTSSSTVENKREIQTDDKAMSRIHCLISVSKVNDVYEYVLSDLSSTNGTEVNTKRISEHDEVILGPKDEIVLGNTLLKLKL